MAYNINNITGMGELMSKMSEFSNGTAGVLFTFLVGIIIFVYGSATDKKNAMIGGAFFMAMSATFARLLGFVNTAAFFMFVIILVGVLIFVIIKE